MDSELERSFSVLEIFLAIAISERHTKKENKNWYGEEKYSEDNCRVKAEESVSEKECRPHNKSYKQNAHSL